MESEIFKATDFSLLRLFDIAYIYTYGILCTNVRMLLQKQGRWAAMQQALRQ